MVWYIYPPIDHENQPISDNGGGLVQLGADGKPPDGTCSTPRKINGWNRIPMEVWFRSFSFLNGCFVGSMLIFQGVCFHSTKRGPHPRTSRCLSSGRSRLQNFLKKKCLDECFWRLFDKSWKKHGRYGLKYSYFRGIYKQHTVSFTYVAILQHVTGAPC